MLEACIGQLGTGCGALIFQTKIIIVPRSLGIYLLFSSEIFIIVLFSSPACKNSILTTAKTEDYSLDLVETSFRTLLIST